MKIWEILVSVLNHQPRSNLGICANFDTVYHAVHGANCDYDEWSNAVDILDSAMDKWPGHSGNQLFPVPDPDNSLLGPADTYSYHSEAGTMWSGSEYASKRIELLNWLIKHLRDSDQ